jgi:hypothetical protein
MGHLFSGSLHACFPFVGQTGGRFVEIPFGPSEGFDLLKPPVSLTYTPEAMEMRVSL